MRKQTLDKETRKAILEARRMIEDIIKADSNEAETRRRIERIFGSLMGYDTLKHISREHAVHGVGDTEYCDFAIQLVPGKSATPDMLVEIKRVGIDLSSKHLKQASSYAINIGCEWVLLTNGKTWELYHISFGQPPSPKLIDSWDIIDHTPVTLAKKFNLVSYKNIKKGGLGRLWEKSNVLTPHNVLKLLLSEASIKSLQRGVKRATDVAVSPEDIVGAIRRLLNESALTEMNKIKISLPEKKQPRKPKAPKAKSKDVSIEEEVEAVLAENQSE